MSRSVTAPFDRLKIYLITTDAPPMSAAARKGIRSPYEVTSKAVGNLWGAVTRIYADGGGVRAFWVGNGLNVIKIFPVSYLFQQLSMIPAITATNTCRHSPYPPHPCGHLQPTLPRTLSIASNHPSPTICRSPLLTRSTQESAIKFVSYEQSKRFLAKYWDCVADVSDLSSSSRFLAGGIGGITSQFAIYGLETLKTRVQSETGPAQGMKTVGRMARTMWRTGGIRAYYRGLTVCPPFSFSPSLLLVPTVAGRAILQQNGWE